MKLVLNEELQFLKDTASNFAKDKAPVSHLRKLRDEDDYVDYDGHGNWGRFNPHNTDDDYYKPKKRRKGKKFHVGKRMNYD